MLKICLAGTTGKVGRNLAKTISISPDLKIISGISNRSAGKTATDVIDNLSYNFHLFSTVEEAFKNNKPDVLIDYTSPSIVKKNVMTALNTGVNVVIGTSGLSDNDYIEIDQLANEKQLGVIAAGNFSLTAALLQHLSQFVAQIIPNWELIDYAPLTKVDSPSGTTKELSYLLKKFTTDSSNIGSNHNVPGSRGAILNNSHIHSVRIPGYLSGAEIQFGLEGERLIIKHEAIDSSPYVNGTLLAVRKVISTKGLHRGLSNLLELTKGNNNVR